MEHGVFADDATRKLLVDNNTFFDPQCGLVFHNYLDNKPWFEGIGNYNAAGFESREKALPLAEAGIGFARHTKGLKLLFGTDAVAGAHGRNAEELVRDGKIYRRLSRVQRNRSIHGTRSKSASKLISRSMS